MQRFTKEELQARFAEKLRTTPRHQAAAEHLAMCTSALARAKRMVTEDPNPEYWKGSVTFWTGAVEFAREGIVTADTIARHEADRARETVTAS